MGGIGRWYVSDSSEEADVNVHIFSIFIKITPIHALCRKHTFTHFIQSTPIHFMNIIYVF